MEYYEILGLSKTAGSAEVKKAYRQLALKYHPDKNSGNKAYEEKFKEISEAYAVLSDPVKKKQYDTYGSADFRQRYSREDIFENFDLNDILRQFGFGGGSFNSTSYRNGMGGGSAQPGFSSIFGQQQSAHAGCGGGYRPPAKGQDMTYQLSVRLQDV